LEEEVEKYKAACITLCDRLLYAMERNREDADGFCNGEIHKSYTTINDKVAGKIRNTKTKIKKL
jgi:hypothetical protein